MTTIYLQLYIYILELYQGITDNKLKFFFQLTKVQVIFLYCYTTSNV